MAVKALNGQSVERTPRPIKILQFGEGNFLRAFVDWQVDIANEMGIMEVINVIMGANVGTTVTSWLLSLSGIEGDNLFIQLLKPMSFTPILALIGVIFQM